MKKILFLVAITLAGFNSFGQKFLVKGSLSDTLNVPLASATVMILNPKDSSLVNFGVTNSAGAFEIKNVNKGSYQLKISYVGFANITKNFSTPETGTVLDLGKLKMLPQSAYLNEIVIQGEKNPVTVKRDTIEFNAGSFKTKANANVEDLLKKMPGIEVDNDGSITAQGESVQQVTVDGREFFGRDPKLATRNLPADAVEKVQVFDKKSDQAAFTGIDDGTKTKTINLELKEEKRNAAFGNIMAGYGTNDRYQGKASINRFSKSSQLSFLGMGNNINEQGFSVGDAMNFSGNSQQMMAGGGGGGNVTIQIGGNNSTVPMNFGGRQSGIMTNYAGGLNFNQDFNKKKTLFGGNYFYSYLDQNIVDTLNRVNFFPNQPVNYYNQGSVQNSTSESHKVNLTLDHKIDSANSLKFTSNLTYSNSEQTNNTSNETLREDKTKIGSSVSNTISTLDNASTNNNLLLRHRFNKKGRTISSNLTYNYSQQESNTRQYTTTNSLAIGEKQINQLNQQKTNNTTAGATVSFTEPLGNRKYLELNYNYRTNINKLDRPSFNTDTNSEIDSLSNQYTSHYIYNRPGFNIRVNRQKYNFSFGTNYQYTRLKGDMISADTTINRVFTKWQPSAHFNYDFSSTRHLRLDYESTMQEPSIRQLQPFFEPSTDQINFYQGNPSLRPANQQTVNLQFTTFDPVRFINFFLRGSLVYQTDAIVNGQSQVMVDGQLKRFTKPVNVKDAVNANVNLNFGFRLQRLLSRFNFGSSLAENKSITMLNEQANTIRTESLGGNARYNFTFKEFFTLDLSANIRNSTTKYDFNTQNDQRYINSTYSAETNISVFKYWQLNADFNYYIYESKTNDFKQTIPILNVWLSRFILKANAGEIKVGVSNLLDKSLSVTQTTSQNYLQQETINNLGRYIMVSFTYALNRQLNPFGGGGRRPGGMRMMMRMD